MKIIVKDKNYNAKQMKLLDIWREYERAVEETKCQVEKIIFINNTPLIFKGNTRNLAGLPATCLRKINQEEELQQMSVENFIYLMVKMGIEVECEDEA